MRISTTVRVVAAIAIPAFASDYTLDLKPENTKIEWTLSDPLHTVHGTFTLTRGEIDFDPATGRASGQVIVDVTSGASGSDARDRKMHSTVLESAKYPEAIFTPSAIEGALAVPGASNIKVRGMLTIHGMAHEMTMDVRATSTADQMQAAITFDVPYVAWGMKNPSNFLLKVSKTVRVSIEATGPIRKR